MLRRALAPRLAAMAKTRVLKYASPSPSRQFGAPGPFSLTYYANLRGRYAASGRMGGSLRFRPINLCAPYASRETYVR